MKKVTVGIGGLNQNQTKEIMQIHAKYVRKKIYLKIIKLVANEFRNLNKLSQLS